MQGELILAMAYGYEAQGRNDRKVEITRQFSDVGSQSVLPGVLLVNNLPFCMCYFHISCRDNFAHDHSTSHPRVAALAEL
jgi:hypothetical protein